MEALADACPRVGLWALEFQLLWVPLPQHRTGSLHLLGCGKDGAAPLCLGALLLALPPLNALCPPP